MISTLKNKAVLTVLALAFLGLGCESGTEPAPQSALEAEPVASSLLGGALEVDSEDSEDSEQSESDDILERTVPLLTEQVASALIGPAGGVLEILGHQLVVPEGAVTDLTQFVMVVVPGTQVLVDLYAFDPLLGTNIGESGFLVPVQLALSYADVPGIKDPSKLRIVHIRTDGGREELETEIDEDAEEASADLEHFSRYGLCRN